MFSITRLFTLCALLFLSACERPTDLPGEPLVVASIRPLSLMVQDLVGSEVEVTTLVPPNADPHSFALRVSDLQKLESAELVIWLGPELERSLEKALARVSSEHQLRLSELQGLSWPQESVGHGHHERDPHLWLSPQNSLLLMQAVAARLTRLLPEHAAAIDENLQRQQQQIQAFIAESHRQLQPLGNRGFAVHHDGYRHFVQDFGLKQLAAVSSLPEERLSARHLDHLQRELAHAACLLVDQVTPEVERLASTLNIAVVAADPLAGNPELTSYLAFLRSLRSAFIACLTTDAATSAPGGLSASVQ